MDKRTDIKHVVDYIIDTQRGQLITDIDDGLMQQKSETFETVKDQYCVGETRNILLALAAGFPPASPWQRDLSHFIELSDLEYGLAETEAEITKPTTPRKKKRA